MKITVFFIAVKRVDLSNLLGSRNEWANLFVEAYVMLAPLEFIKLDKLQMS